MQPGLIDDLGRQLVETVGENLERDPRITVQQFRERRLARMRQWDRATGDPETTDRIVGGGLIGLRAFTDANVQEIPRLPAASTRAVVATPVATPSVTTKAAVPVAAPAVTSVKPASPAEAPSDPALFCRLRSWRLATAQQEGQKAFYAFPDATLECIAAAKPQTLEKLEAIKDVGPEVEVKPLPVKLEECAVVPSSLEIAERYFPVVPTGLRDDHWAYIFEPRQVRTTNTPSKQAEGSQPSTEVA